MSTWGYNAGTSGTVIVPTTKRVLSIIAVSRAGGTVTINGGDAIPVPANLTFEMTLAGRLDGGTIEFAGTVSYVIETEDIRRT